MTTISLRGDVPNLMVLRDDLQRELVGEHVVEFTITADPIDEESLGHAQWGELVVSFGTGVLANATWDAFKAALAAARRRGRVEQTSPPEIDPSDDS